MNRVVEHTQKLVNYIEDNIAEDIDITTIAKSFGISPWYLQHSFKALVGDTLGGYVRGRKMNQAIELMENTSLDLIDVAIRVGFSSHEAFTRAFQKQFGMTPSKYRKDRPKILLQAKPTLSEDLVEHLKDTLDTAPKIYERSSTKILGFPTKLPSPFIEFDRSCADMNPAWMKLFGVENDIPERIRGSYVGAILSPSGKFTEEFVSHIASVIVSENVTPQNDMEYYEFPKQLVAEFSVAKIDSTTVARTIDYIYGFWLPNSDYTRAEGSDYELFENVSNFADPGVGSKYVVPVKKMK